MQKLLISVLQGLGIATFFLSILFSLVVAYKVDDANWTNCRANCKDGIILECHKRDFWAHTGIVKCETNEGIRIRLYPTDEKK